MSAALTFVFYNLIFILFCRLVYKASRSGEKKRKRLILTACVLCGLVAAFRGNTGTDSAMYRNVYIYGVGSLTRWVEFEPGFKLAMKIMHLMHMPYQAFFFLWQFISTYLCIKFILYYQKDIDVRISSFAYITSLFFSGLNAMRQIMAIAICLYAICVFFDNHRKKAIVLICVSGLFHRSGLICLGVVALYFVIRNKKVYKFVIAGSIVVIAFLVVNRSILGSIIRIVTGSGYYSAYFTRDAYVDSSLFSYYLKQLPLLFILISNIIYNKFDRKSGKGKYWIYVLTLFGVVLSSIASITDTQAGRLGLYFSSFKILVYGLISYSGLMISRKTKIGYRYCKYGSMAYMYLIFIYDYFIKNFSSIVPYEPLR